MVKLKSNYHQKSPTWIKNVTTVHTSSSFKRWIILFFLLYKLDYKDYCCYGISSAGNSGINSAILNNENGKTYADLFLFLCLYFWNLYNCPFHTIFFYKFLPYVCLFYDKHWVTERYSCWKSICCRDIHIFVGCSPKNKTWTSH